MLDRIASQHSRSGGAILALGVIALLLHAPDAHAANPALQCQAGKNKAAGAYAACRQSAEAKRASSGDTAKYNAAISKCETKLASTWSKANCRG